MKFFDRLIIVENNTVCWKQHSLFVETTRFDETTRNLPEYFLSMDQSQKDNFSTEDGRVTGIQRTVI